MAWRLQYHGRKATKQYPFTFDFTRQESFEYEFIDELNIKDILSLIDEDLRKKISPDYSSKLELEKNRQQLNH